MYGFNPFDTNNSVPVEEKRNLNIGSKGFLEPDVSVSEEWYNKPTHDDRVMFSPKNGAHTFGKVVGTMYKAFNEGKIKEPVKVKYHDQVVNIKLEDITGIKPATENEWFKFNAQKFLRAGGTKIDEMIAEANRSLNDNAASMIERATGICMEVWFSLTHTFHAQADKYDPELVNPSDKFMYFKLAPGGDSRDDAYKRIIDACESLCDKLNDAVGRAGLFTPDIIRKDGHLEVRARYAEGSGGIFHAKTKDMDVGVGITLTMPRQGVIRDAFKALITTPAFPIGDDIPDPEKVIPDAPPKDDEDAPMGGTADSKSSLGDLGGVNIVGGAPKPLPRQESKMTNRPQLIEEGKLPAEGFRGPTERGYYVVYGDGIKNLSSPRAEWYWEGDWGNGIALPGKRFISKAEAIRAKDEIRKKFKQPDEFGESDPFKGDWQFHVKWWDGRTWNSISFEVDILPDIHIPNPHVGPPTSARVKQDIAPLSSGGNVTQTSVPVTASKSWPNRRAITEEAANATGGYQTAMGGSVRGNDVTADAGLKRSMTVRRKKQVESTVDQWRAAASGLSLSGGPFGR